MVLSNLSIKCDCFIVNMEVLCIPAEVIIRPSGTRRISPIFSQNQQLFVLVEILPLCYGKSYIASLWVTTNGE